MNVEKSSLAGKGEEISFKIPKKLTEEFEEELRIVLKFPILVCIPVDYEHLKDKINPASLKDFDIVLYPKQMQR